MSRVREARLKTLVAARVVLITDHRRSRGRTIESVVHDALQGGIRAVQLREKDWADEDLLAAASILSAECAKNGTTFIVNSRADIAVATGADGVHLPASGATVGGARRICGPDMLIGRSVHSTEEVLKAESEGADYLQLGTIFPTASKRCAPTGGLDIVNSVAGAVRVPVIAIGGINAGNICPVLQAGASGAAVIGAISESDDVQCAVRELIQAVSECRLVRDPGEGFMTIIVNGQEREVEDGISLTAFLSSLNVEPRRVIVELNGEILARDGYDIVFLKPGDNLEVVHFVGGGCI